MATLREAIAQKALEIYTLPQWERRKPIRDLWFAPQLWDWVDGTQGMSEKVGGRTLDEHIELMFCEFRCAEPFPAGDLRQSMPTKDGIRKLYPPKLRIYGWCPAANEFVAVTGALEADTKKDKSLNNKKHEEVLQFIQRNGLNGTVLLGDNLAVFPPKS